MRRAGLVTGRLASPVRRRRHAVADAALVEQVGGAGRVVETTNFIPVNGRALTVFGANETTLLVERFTRVDENTIDYEFTVSDPIEYTRP